jgi:heterodisulfide reductase subunit B
MAKKSGLKAVPFWGCMIPLKYPQMELALRRTLPNIGIQLVDLEGFTCCPDPIYFKARNKLNWLTIAARNLSVAEERGLPVITMCSGCTSTLKEARFLLAEDSDLRFLLAEDSDLLATVNSRLKRIGREYKGEAVVKHAVTLIRDELGVERVAQSVKEPLDGLKVAIHYGCHLLKPSQIMGVDDTDYPSIMEELVHATGATPVSHSEKLLCCGKGCVEADLPLQMVYNIFASIEASGADCMGLICPTCFSSFDLGQIFIARQKGKEFNIPVIYYFQLLGLAQGLAPEEVGLHLHRVKVEPIMAKVKKSGAKKK